MKTELKIGDSVRVKEGIKVPDYEEFDMSNWQGRITQFSDEYGTVEIKWDSITLKTMPLEFIENSIDEGCEYSVMWLEKSEVEKAEPRDKDSDVERIKNELEKEYGNLSFDEQEKRIAKILKKKNIEVNMDNLKVYFTYLKANIKFPCKLTGMEDFQWEEPYLLGGWSKKEYERLKKENASYTDEFELMGFDDEIEDGSGIFVKVKRISDKKEFTLPLWDLKTISRKDQNNELISDYSSWMTNFK
jgi:hypothetical protein